MRDGRDTNDRMAEVGLQQLDRLLGGLQSRRVLVLGASYREDVKELAFSTVFPVVKLLHRAGAQVLVLDPLFRREELQALEAEVVDDVDTATSQPVDAIVVQAWHRDFRHLDWRRFKGLKAVLDGRGSVDPAAIRQAGAAYIAIGISETRAAAPK